MRSSPFSPQVLHAARTLTLPPTLWQRPQVRGITIDGPESMDLDDAIWLEPTADGGAIASIHIADVSVGIPLGSLLDQAALERTATQYYPGYNAPMLPRPLSEAAFSLLEGQRRPTLTVRIQLGPLATVQHVELLETWLINEHKFSYASADATVTNPSHPHSDLLQSCQFWAEQLYERRKAAGAIGGMAAEPGEWIDENGHLVTSAAARYHSHQIIQELMILANTAVAQWLAERNIAALYRNHTVRDLPPEHTVNLSHLIASGQIDAIYQRLQHCLNRAEYSPHLSGHFALKLPAYCHFTSPIRRIADLINHRIVKAHLQQQPHPYPLSDLEALGTYIAQVLTERETATSNYYRGQRTQLYATQLIQTKQLHTLTAKEFSRLVKYTTRHQELDKIAAELLRRLQLDELLPQDLYLVLMVSEHPTLPAQFLDYLASRTHIAQSLITIATGQAVGWQAIAFVETTIGSDFAAWLEVIIQGQPHTTVTASLESRKQAARHQACWLWIEAYLQKTLVAPDQRVAPPAPPVLEVEPTPVIFEDIEGNSIASLNTLTQKMRWPVPAYDISAHEQGFICHCQVEIPASSALGMGRGKSKREAKHAAARQVLLQLQARGDLPTGPP